MEMEEWKMSENDYEKAIGIWTHTIGSITHKIVPEEGDNIEFVRIKERAAKEKDESLLNQGVADLYFKMVERSDKGLTDDKKKKLKSWIGLNIIKILDGMMITYNWTTQEKLDKIRAKQESMHEEMSKKKMTAMFEEEKTS